MHVAVEVMLRGVRCAAGSAPVLSYVCSTGSIAVDVNFDVPVAGRSTGRQPTLRRAGANSGALDAGALTTLAQVVKKIRSTEGNARQTRTVR